MRRTLAVCPLEGEVGSAVIVEEEGKMKANRLDASYRCFHGAAAEAQGHSPPPGGRMVVPKYRFLQSYI